MNEIESGLSYTRFGCTTENVREGVRSTQVEQVRETAVPLRKPWA